MPRPERPLGPEEDALLQFAADLRRLREKAGNPTYRDLSKAAHYSASVLSEAANGRKRPTLAVTLAYVEACGGDPAEWETRWHELGAELTAVEVEEPGPAPYVGLAAFQPNDADRFFGRERLVRTLQARVEQRRFVGVFGASGSGKSSLLRAGLVARATTPTLVFTPASHPMEECAVGLAALTGESAAILRPELDADPHNLHLRVRQIMAQQPPGTDLLLVIDQFEEIFTVCPDRDERARFVEALVFAATTPTSRARVVIGVRADFYGHCGQLPELVEVLHDAQVLVGPMTADELREAITAPAARAGCLVETALVSRLISDTSGQGAVLPLVSHALLETWRRRNGARLTLGGYEAAGGIQHAIARSAEQVHTTLDADQQDMARQIFLRLTALGEGTEDTKRRFHQRELDIDNPNTAVVLEKLVRARLLTLHHDSIEIAHEALIRCWPRLRDWLNDDREGLRIHRQLTEATDGWESLARDQGALYRGARLAMAKDWASTRDGALTAREREFLEASLAAQAQEQSAARRRTRRLRQLVALLAVLLLLASAAIVYAVRAERTATGERNIALARKVVGDAAALRATNPALAVQLSLAAYRLVPMPETRDNLLGALADPFSTRISAHTKDVMSAAISPDGRTLATGSSDNTTRLQDIADVHRPGDLATLSGHTDVVNAVAFTKDGRMLATASSDHSVRLWDVSDPRFPRESANLAGHTDGVNAVAFSPDGLTLATAGNDKTVRLWDVREHHEIATLTGHTAVVRSVVYSPDGLTVATASGDRTARLWDVRERREVAAFTGHTAAVRSVAFGPDGQTVATAGNDKTIRLWSVRERRQTATLAGHTDIVNSVAFGPDGAILASGGNDYTVRLWDLTDPGGPRELATLTGHTNIVHSVVFGRDGATLATTSADKTTRLEDVPRLVLGRHTDAVRVAVFSPDGTTLATASNDKTARLWDLRDPDRPRAGAVFGDRTNTVWAALFSPNGQVVATTHDDKLVRLWRVGDASLVGTLAGHTDAVWSARFSPNGQLMATTGGDSTTRLWDISNPGAARELATIPAGTITSMRFSPNGRTLATANTDNTARLWDISNPGAPKELAALTGHTARVTQVAFSPDGWTLATASWDHTVRLWDITDLRAPNHLASLTGHTETVTSVVFSPDGRTLASGSHDRTARLWDVGDVRHPRGVATLAGHTGIVISVAFSPDGHTLATASHDHTARLWETDVDRVAARVCQLAAPGITRSEWERYFPGLAYQPPCG